MTIENINKAISVLAKYLGKPVNEISFGSIDVYKPKGSDITIIEVEFINGNEMDSLEIRSFNCESFEIWGYDMGEIERIGSEINCTKKRLL